MWLVPAAIRQYSKLSPRLTSSRRSVSVISALVVPGALCAIVAIMASITFSDAVFSIASSCGDLRRRWRSSTTSASLISLSGIALLSAAPESIGMNVVSIPMRFAGTPELFR